jgi:hypothetical protein
VCDGPYRQDDEEQRGQAEEPDRERVGTRALDEVARGSLHRIIICFALDGAGVAPDPGVIASRERVDQRIEAWIAREIAREGGSCRRHGRAS